MNNKNDKFESREIISMFPTFVWQTMIEEKLFQSINNDIINKLHTLRKTTPEANHGVSWQSARDLHHLEEFQTLISLIMETANSVLSFLKIGHKGIQLTGCWANMNEVGSRHKIHSHPNNFLSGAYYVQTDEGSDTINFHDPRLQTGIIRPPVTELTAENTDQVVVRVKNGMFLLFPSWLQHSIDANESTQARISISFNMMFSSYAETMSRPLW
ncbi:MAG: 2OG-Fe(II) oxygenase family protein [Candidatus Reddybacter sp.]